MKSNIIPRVLTFIGIAIGVFAIWFVMNAAVYDNAYAQEKITDEGLSALRSCESGAHGTYRANTGNGYYGAYQFDIPTWNDSVVRAGYPEWSGVLPSDSPDYVQDAAARETHSRRGTQPWPRCGFRMETGQHVAGYSYNGPSSDSVAAPPVPTATPTPAPTITAVPIEALGMTDSRGIQIGFTG